MPAVIEPIERWNPEIRKYLEHKFDCYYYYEGAKVVTENIYVRKTVVHKYTHCTVGKVIKFHRKSTLTPVLEKLLSELTPVVAKVLGNPIYPLNLDDLISVVDRDLPYDWGFGVLDFCCGKMILLVHVEMDITLTVYAMVSEVSHNLSNNS